MCCSDSLPDLRSALRRKLVSLRPAQISGTHFQPLGEGHACVTGILVLQIRREYNQVEVLLKLSMWLMTGLEKMTDSRTDRRAFSRTACRCLSSVAATLYRRRCSSTFSLKFTTAPPDHGVRFAGSLTGFRNIHNSQISMTWSTRRFSSLPWSKLDSKERTI